MKTNPNDSIHRGQDSRYSTGEFKAGALGLTKREYFAAMAMQGILSDSKTLDYLGRMKLNPETFAVKQADALITELNKELK